MAGGSPFCLTKTTPYMGRYMVSSHAVLLAEGPAVLQPAQLGPRVASRRAAELHRVGGRHGVQQILHLGRGRPVGGAWTREQRDRKSALEHYTGNSTHFQRFTMSLI